MTALALAGNCGLRGESGLPRTGAVGGSVAPTAAPGSMPKREARLSAPKPMPVRAKKSRRVKIMLSTDGECSRRNLSEQVWQVSECMAFSGVVAVMVLEGSVV